MPITDSFRERFHYDNIPAIALVTYVIAVFAWLVLIKRWLPMPGGAMDMQMSDPGAPEAMALENGFTGVGLYLVMWAVMMIAMMYPSSVPLFRLYYKTIEGTTKGRKAARVAAFMGTYVLVWTLTGVVPLVVNAVVPLATVADQYTGFLMGGTLLLLAGYQMSPYKYRCLRYCRSPLGFLMSNHRPGVRGAARMSWEFSVFCVGCCWALFAFMVVVGSMNIVWMALITVVLSLERAVSWGERLARRTGIVAGIAGVAVLAISVV
ncbi:DUF2182 domain-containing protein [Natrinema gelatinilyticum]|uniref:DUF2182 domain-containing protein n=1 Tax=Natrinema gelatinilyticum TaxID=2961571 RepID=UPI0020C3B493|nr:DUF2182 domain-containing protein [Natrinema gelatinilyticum]